MIKSKRHILVADDDEVLLELLQIVLLQKGFEVTAVRAGEELLVQLAKRSPDLIILDIMLPGLGGFEILRKLKGDKAHHSIPIMMLSGRAGERDQVQAFDFGAADYIVKPFRPDELVTRINRVFARRMATKDEMK